MTELIYQTDSYCKDFYAEVRGVDDTQNGVYLNRTAFYPGGGGQPNDTGTLKIGETIYKVVKVAKGNLHILEGDLPKLGASVLGTIDWETRYQLMRIHTALHVLCGVVFHDYGALVTGGDMNPLHGRMDFEFERMQKELVTAIETRINQVTSANHAVEIKILPREEAFQIPDLLRTKINLLPPQITEIRTVNIIGLDLQACGGTHLNNTSEVGTMKISDYKSKGGINKRIYLDIEG
jgi:misacylated tRNA(Ala) deacylase